MNKLLSKILEPKDSTSEAAYYLSSLLNAKISQSTLDKEIHEHPNYPGFLSISDVLNKYDIENIVARFDINKFKQLPTPFILQLKQETDTYQFGVVKTIENNTAQYYNTITKTWQECGVDELFHKSMELVLLAQAEDGVIETKYEEKLKEEKIKKISDYAIASCIPLIIIIASVYSYFDLGSNAIFSILFTVLTFIGSVITILLLWYEVDQNNALLQQICAAGRKRNCGAVLQSTDAKIFGISWSSIGFVYFTGSLISLLALGISTTTTLNFLALLNVIAVPYIIYSIYYQRKIKQWCVLCLSVQAILALQFIVAFLADWQYLPLTFYGLIKILPQLMLAYALPFIMVSIMMPKFKKAKQGEKTFLELQRLKHSPEIFQAMLEKQRQSTISAEGLGITIGNRNATNKIIKVCNPYCGPCANAHSPMEELLSNNPDLQLQIIFNVTNEKTDLTSHPVRHLLAIDEAEDGKMTSQALDDWYLAETKNYNIFSSKYPLKDGLNRQDRKIDAMQDWCNKTNIHFTPTFFINGYQLPPNYSVNDLKYFFSM